VSFLQKEITLPKLRVPTVGRPTVRPPRRRGGASRSAVVGLEIGATQVIAARAHLQDGRIVADQVAVRPLPPDLVRDGLVLDGAALAAELRGLFHDSGLSRQVRVGLATPRTIVRVIDLPPLDEADVRVALALHAQDRIPMPLNGAVLDHQTVGLIDTPEGERLRVIVVATERTGVEHLTAAIRSAGLRPVGIDLSAFAAIRALAGPDVPLGPVLYVQLADLANLAIADAGICDFTRQAPQGLAHILGRLVEQRGGTLQEAHALLLAAAGDSPGEPSRAGMSEVGQVLARVAGEIGSELRAAAEFYGNQSGASVNEGIVTGALAPLPGFVDALGEASGLQLRRGEVAVAGPDALGGLDPGVALVAAGLAVGRLG
jgi:type IV pilus assembly protein PilM